MCCFCNMLSLLSIAFFITQIKTLLIIKHCVILKIVLFFLTLLDLVMTNLHSEWRPGVQTLILREMLHIHACMHSEIRKHKIFVRDTILNERPFHIYFRASKLPSTKKKISHLLWLVIVLVNATLMIFLTAIAIQVLTQS